MGRMKVKSNGNIRHFPSSRVAGEMANHAKKNQRGWLKIMFGEFTPSLAIDRPSAYMLEVRGLRNDDVAFTVTIALDKGKMDMIPSAAITMRVTRDAMQRALDQLQTFLECSCTVGTSCEQHRSN